MRKKVDFDYLVSDYEKRFGKKNFGRKVKILHQEEIEKLESLREFLLPMLMNGQISIA